MATVTVKVTIPTSNQRVAVESFGHRREHPPLVISSCLQPAASLLSPDDITDNMRSMLSSIWHPVLYPFFDSFLPPIRYIAKQYSLLLDRREILRIEELVIRIRISHQYPLASLAELEYATSVAEMLIKTANQGITYIERHCRENGLKLNLRALETNRRSSFADTWPYDVLLPYARTCGLLEGFEKYDHCRGYEYFVPGYESLKEQCVTCEFRGASQTCPEGESSKERRKTGIWVLMN